MADRIITAEAIITAKDATGDVFTKIAGKFQQLGKGAKVSADIERMAKTIEQANSQLRALDKLQSTRTGFSDARAKFQAQKVAVEQAARAMRDAEKPTRALETAYQRAQAEVSKAAAAFERSKTAMLDAKHAAEGFGTPLARVAAEQARLKGVIDGTTRAIEHQTAAESRAAIAHARAEKAAEKRAEGIRHHGLGNYAAAAAAGVVGVHSIMRFAEGGIEAGAERQHVIAGMKNAGMPDDEIARAQARAVQVSKSTPNLSVTELLELHKEARSAVQHPEEVFEVMPELAKATSVLKGMGAESANVADLVKGAESLGLMNDPKRFHRFLEGQVKAMSVMGRTITTEQIYEAAKYSKSAGSTLSDDFLNLTMPSLIQEMHGSSAGDALSSLTKRWRGGLNHQHLAVQRLQQVGMLEDPTQIKRSKTGEILGYGGKLVGDDVLGADPGKFFQDVLNPKMEAAGITTLSDKVKFLNETLPSTAANVGRILIQQEETLRQHRRNYEAAPGLDQAVENQKSDPTVAMKGLGAALNDLGSSVSIPAIMVATKGITLVSGSLKELSDAASNHPMLATGGAGLAVGGGLLGAGYASYQLMNGFGLGSSATALDTSAAALDGAAAALDAAAVKMGAGSVAGGVAGGVEKGLLGGAGGGVGGEILRDGGELAGAVGAVATGMAITAGAAIMGATVYGLSRHPNRGRFRAYQNRPALGDVFGPGVQMPLTIGDLPIDGADGHFGGTGLTGRQEADSLRKTDLPGHYVFGRGGVREYVVDRGPTPFRGTAPYFSRGIYEDARAMPLGTLGNVPMGRVPSLVGAPALSQAAAFPSGPIDVTGKVSADVHSTVDVKTKFELSVPAGFGVKQTFQSVFTHNQGLSEPGAQAEAKPTHSPHVH